MESANTDLTRQLKELESSRSDEVNKRKSMEKELVELRSKYQPVVDENEALKIEVQGGVLDIEKVLGEGYDKFLKRVSGAGFDITGHSFDEYMHDYAALNPGGD